MKKFCIICILLLFCGVLSMKAEKVKVSLKSGVTLVGELVEMDVNSHVKVLIGGLESVISMADIESVEMVDDSNLQSNIQNNQSIKLLAGDYEVTDNRAYPDSFVVNIAGQEFTMLLVRGGTFTMGFDGRHSMSWESEPMHRVTISSFYISKELVSSGLANSILGKKTKTKDFSQPFDARYRKDVESLLDSIGIITMKSFRLPTEAEWEYTAIGPLAYNVLGKKNGDRMWEWCEDWWGKFTPNSQINPNGPDPGKYHVLRSYMRGNEKWQRKHGDKSSIFGGSEFFGPTAYIRIAISADDIK